MSRKLLLSIIIGASIYNIAAEARGGGKFLGSLVGRAAVRGAAGAVSSSSNEIKTYGPDVLTVSQLAQCIKKASKLDDDSARLESERVSFQSVSSKIEVSKSQVMAAQSVVDNRSKRSVDAFNALVDRHNLLVQTGKSSQATFNAAVDSHNAEANAYNAECGKKYYPSDLESAQSMASVK